MVARHSDFVGVKLMEKAYAYLRVSTEEQNEENQLKDVKRYAHELGLELVEVYREHGVSAWKKNNRKVFSRMLKDAVREGIEHIVVWDFDRVERNRRRFIELVRELRRGGIRLHSVRQRWLEELNQIPEPWGEIVGDLMLHIVGWMAEEESSKRSERVRAAYERMREEGEVDRWGRPPLTSYIPLERIAEIYVEEGSLRRTAERVRSEIRARPKPRVAPNTVRRCLMELVGDGVSVERVREVLKSVQKSTSAGCRI